MLEDGVFVFEHESSVIVFGIHFIHVFSQFKYINMILTVFTVYVL